MKLTPLSIVLIILLAAAGFILIWKQLNGLTTAYSRQVNESLSSLAETEQEITRSDLDGLPPALQRFFSYTGVVGTPRVRHFSVDFSGSMRMEEDGAWLPIRAQQHSFIGEGRRLFLMKMKYRGLPMVGYHHYSPGDAYMTIRIMDLFTVVHNQDEYMIKGETVTWFNDLCIMAPGALLDAEVTWEEIDANHVRGRLTRNGVTVEAVLSIDDEGRLVDFVSGDRYAARNDGSYDNVPWSTPMHGFEEVNGVNLSTEGYGVWHYPDRKYEYIKLKIENVVINPAK